jgi:hypothetical protein
MAPAIAHAEGDVGASLSFDAGLAHSTTVTPASDSSTLFYGGTKGQIHVGALIFGLHLDLAQDLIFGRSELTGSGFVGYRLAGERVRLEATGELGAHNFDGVGNSFVDPTISAGVTLPAVGAEVRLEVRAGRSWMGLTAFVRRDLGTAKTTAVENTDACFISCDGTPPRDYTVGGTTVGLALSRQWDFGS